MGQSRQSIHLSRFPMLRPHRPLLIVAILLVLAGLTARAGAAAPVWRKIEAPDFVLYSDAPERAAMDCAVRYAVFRSAFRQLFVPPGHTMPSSIVIAFRNADEFERIAPKPQRRDRDLHIVNTHVELDGVACSAFSIGSDRDAALRLTFEFETIWAMPHLGYYVPLWMAQGAGEILSNLEVRKDRCLLGADDHPRVGEAIPWPKFFGVSSSSKTYQDMNALPDYLNQAWGLMHWVLFNDSGIGPRFSDLAHRLRTNVPEEAVSQAMATTPEHFNTAIRDHFRHGRYPIALPVDEAAIRASFHLGAVDPAEITARTAELLLSTERAAEAEVQIEQVHAFSPDVPAVKEAWARRLRREGRNEDAAELYRELIDAGSRNVAALLFSASLRLDDVQTGGRDVASQGGEPAALALAEVRRALALDPGSLEAARLLGRTLYVLPQITDENLAELGALIPPGADGLAVRFYHGMLAQRLGHFGAASADFHAIETEPNALPVMRRQAAAQRVWLLQARDRQMIAPLLDAHDFAGARRITTAGLADLGADNGDNDDDRLAPYRQLVTWIDEAEGWQKLRDAYDAGRWPDTREAALAYAAKFPGSQRTRVARQLADDAAQHLAAPAEAGRTH